MKLKREDFFAHEKMLKLISIINRKSLLGFNYTYVKDKSTIKFLKDNIDWLDYVGISIYVKPDKKTLCLKWNRLT